MKDKTTELPPLPPPFKKAVYATSANTKSVRDGFEMGGYEKEPPLFDDAQMQEYATAAIEADRKRRHLKERAQLDAEWVVLRQMRQQYEDDRKRKGEPVAWGAFYFGGKRNGKLYNQSETEAQIDAYIADAHRSNDSITLRKGPLYTAPQPLSVSDIPAEHNVDYKELYEQMCNRCDSLDAKLAQYERSGRAVAYPVRVGREEGRLAKRPYQTGDYLPAVGSYCLISGANCDIESDQHRGYLWRQVLGYSDDKEFICLQTSGCWPAVERLTKCWFADIPHPTGGAPQPAEPEDKGKASSVIVWEHRTASECLDRLGIRKDDGEDCLSLWGRLVEAFRSNGITIKAPLIGPYSFEREQPAEPAVEKHGCHGGEGATLPAEPVKVPSDDERAAQGLPPYNPRLPTDEEMKRLTENGRKAWGKGDTEPVKVPSDDVQRDPSGETWMGMRVAAYQYIRPLTLPGTKETATTRMHVAHWSTAPPDAERLYRESDVRALLASYGQPTPPADGQPSRNSGELGEAIHLRAQE